MAGARYVYGKNSVKAILDTHPERVFKILLGENLKPDKRLQAIQDIARARRIPIQQVPRQKLDQMLRSHMQEEASQANASKNRQQETPMREHVRPESRGREPAAHKNGPSQPGPKAASPADGFSGTSRDEEPIIHQGVVASVAPKALLNLPALISRCQEKISQGQHPRLLLLDGVTDPRNFGAVLRVADAAGLDGVIVPKHHSAGFGPAVSKTASGAEETVEIAVVANLNNAIRDLKSAGFWIAGAAHDPKAVDYHKQDYGMPIALIMGSEDKGLADLVRKNCDFLIKIPMHGTVESLNVATATAILLFEMVKSGD